MSKPGERGERARRAAERRAEREHGPKKEPYRVLIAIHRPRYRSRADRAVRGTDWLVRSLLNREDPIGLINQQAPNILILSADFGRNKDMAYLKAAQRYRAAGMKIVGVFEEPEEAEMAAELCDVALVPPWRTLELRQTLAAIYREQRGEEPSFANEAGED